MRIAWLEIDNFRALKQVHLDLEEDLSLIVGRNNTGKTSMLLALERLTQNRSPKVTASDLNTDFLKALSNATKNDTVKGLVGQGIALRVRIDYDEDDNIARLRPALMDLDPNNNSVIIEWRYAIDPTKVDDFTDGFRAWICAREGKEDGPVSLCRYLTRRMGRLFTLRRYSLEIEGGEPANRGVPKELEYKDVRAIFHFEAIRAPRAVSNTESNSALSHAAQRYYKSVKESEGTPEAAELQLDKAFDDADEILSKEYSQWFKEIIQDVREFGGTRAGESELVLQSNLDVDNVLNNSLQVGYAESDDSTLPSLPEWTNGLGYMNLIGILMEVEVALIKMKATKETASAAVNLLFVEEPEAHTHPQLQRIFMGRIKNMVKTRWGGKENDTDETANTRVGNSLQSVVTTHSPHIVASADFNDIKYFRRTNNGVRIKNLFALEASYHKEPADLAWYKFLTHYLTVSRADIFFADEMILFEGDTERILLPAMMAKYDLESGTQEENLEKRLTARNVALIEVGNYSQVFDPLVRFLGLRTLVITDADYMVGSNKSCYVVGSSKCGNGAVKHFLGGLPEFDGDSGTYVSQHRLTELVYDEDKGAWRRPSTELGEKAMLCLAMQGSVYLAETTYAPSSFEDAFFAENKSFVIMNKKKFRSLKNPDEIKDSQCPYSFAQRCIDSKPSFAMDVLFYSSYDSGSPFGGWNTPRYIKEGLAWLAQS